MAGKKSRISRVSMGGRQRAHERQEAKRQAKFAAKREAGNAYAYKPNPYKAGSTEWTRENMERAEKAKSSKLPYARMRSIFAKLDNQLEKNKEAAQKFKQSNKNKEKAEIA